MENDNALKQCGLNGINVDLSEPMKRALDLSVNGSMHRVLCIPTVRAPTWSDGCVKFTISGKPSIVFSVDVYECNGNMRSVTGVKFTIQTLRQASCNRTLRVNKNGRSEFTVPSNGKLGLKVCMHYNSKKRVPVGVFSVGVRTGNRLWYSPPFVHYYGTPADAPTLQNICLDQTPRLHLLARVADDRSIQKVVNKTFPNECDRRETNECETNECDTREMNVFLLALGSGNEYVVERKIAVVDVPTGDASLGTIRRELELDAEETPDLLLPKQFLFLYRGALCPTRKEGTRSIKIDKVAIVAVRGGGEKRNLPDQGHSPKRRRL